MKAAVRLPPPPYRPLKRADTMDENNMPLTIFHHVPGAAPAGVIRRQRSCESLDSTYTPPPPETLTRRDALVPEQQQTFFDSSADALAADNSETGRRSCDNVIIVPHMQMSPGDLHLYNRAITSGGSALAGLQKTGVATHAFYSDDDRRGKSPWILKRLYDWSHRAKTREIARHTQRALDNQDGEFSDERLLRLLKSAWPDELLGAADTVDPSQKRLLQAVWELLYSEIVFLYQQLLVLRNVYREPLKSCQVEGCLLSVQPELLFGNLDQLCNISFSFCQEFVHMLLSADCQTHGPAAVVVSLFQMFSKGPSTLSAYQAYCINYKATLEYLDSVRQRDERFVEFERICMLDARCKRLQLEDLLIAPLHRITRLPLLLREILKHSADEDDREQVEEIIDTMQESLRSIDDSIQWLHNFERIQELQTQLVWPPVSQLEPRTFVPDFLKLALSRQFCENLLAHPRRKLIYEGTLISVEPQKQNECYAFLFNDMLLLTKAKKSVVRKKTGVSSKATDTTQRYFVQRQPVPLDSCVFCDVGPHDTASIPLRYAFVIIHLTRFYQVVSVYTLQAASKEDKERWIEKFQESIEHYESIQLKDMLRCTPLVPTGSGRGSRRTSRQDGRTPPGSGDLPRKTGAALSAAAAERRNSPSFAT